MLKLKLAKTPEVGAVLFFEFCCVGITTKTLFRSALDSVYVAIVRNALHEVIVETIVAHPVPYIACTI